MDVPSSDFVHAGSLAELKAKGRLVVHGRHSPILVIYDGGRVFALDNRCPHMGFPLDRGSVADGILTCHWHHADFDLASGCTFDLWADDVPTCPVELRDGEVWIRPSFGHGDPAQHWRRRLDDGLRHNLGLVIAKAVRGQLVAEVPPREILRQAALFAVGNRDGWGVGATILVALGNLLPLLPEEETYLALFHGARRVAADCDGEAPRRESVPLASRPDLATLQRWLRHWSGVRHREAAERTLLTAIASDAPPAALASLLFAAATDRAFAGSGHALDFVNKACECLDLIGWEHASAVLPSVVGQMVAARGADESTTWRHPVDLVTLCEKTAADLPDLFTRARRSEPWSDHAELSAALLGDDARAILEALEAAILAGASPADLGRSLAYAAALRVAHFGTSNEHADWETVLHVFTYANAIHQALKRLGADAAAQDGGIVAARGVLHGAMAVYLARYLNVPPARLPGEDGDRLDELPDTIGEIRAALLETFDHHRQVDRVGRLVARHLTLGHPPEALIATLAQGLLREDAGFHAYQMLEAGVRQFGEWGNTDPGRHILVAVARYLAAHSPTERAAFQTADIAQRLLRGGELHQCVGNDCSSA
ncbi:Rieske (2Fe-2S) protein [Methylobacterium nodulans]|uniref:Rieske (2Fe-2S) domain protein n=1 Tax=Methylobacterium nodulans (strain LMG 21967 / CNCM I-2342 / ORS 2060) TaxID=460265 RepID=B8IMG8_METNO|nr:Rieske (2Fe-2S) protein [Methylobacterium nodulans]ACL58354.1 Rieske (2Fe-2S) domain protein [Methylobacterium nodulans ORS 2060]